MKQLLRATGALLCSLLLLGCDDGASTAGEHTVRSRIAVDLGALRASTAPFQTQPDSCISVLDELTLTVTMASGRTVTLRRSIASTTSTEVVEVTVEVGTVTFQAEIASTNGTLLYGGVVSQTIRNDGFDVPLRVDPLAPVLEICPAEVLLFPDNQFVSEFAVFNRGVDSLGWSAVSESCGGEPCFRLDPRSGIVPAGTAQLVLLGRGNVEIAPATLAVRIESDEGNVELPVRIRP